MRLVTHLAVAVIGDQVRYGKLIRAGGWSWDRFVYCCNESVLAQGIDHEQLGVHPQRFHHRGSEGLG